MGYAWWTATQYARHAGLEVRFQFLLLGGFRNPLLELILGVGHHLGLHLKMAVAAELGADDLQRISRLQRQLGQAFLPQLIEKLAALLQIDAEVPA